MAYKFRAIKILKQIVRAKGIIEKFHEYKENQIKSKIPIDTSKLKLWHLNRVDTALLDELNYNTDALMALRRLIFDFLYNSDEKQKDIAIYKLKNKSGSFLVVGKNVQLKLHYKSNFYRNNKLFCVHIKILYVLLSSTFCNLILK